MTLRVQLIRENRDGLEHVDALMRLHRLPMPEVKRATRRTFRRGELRREVAAVLRDGLKPRAAIAARVQSAYGFTPRRARATVDNTLGRMQRGGAW